MRWLSEIMTPGTQCKLFGHKWELAWDGYSKWICHRCSERRRKW